ncbi:hypothetical protein DFJ74DRAFT_644098 [Hyaloraphidium curvatum]|nr:hypothetical protein DFJ74DRAFT_644098 [Hyaloraphidium curvatum]
MHLLFETASGYALFERLESEEIGQDLDAVQKSMVDLAKLGKIVKLKSFAPFKSAAHALENINDVSEGIVNEFLKSFLEMNLPGKKSKIQLGVGDKTLGGSIKQELGFDVVSNETVTELLRGIRLFADKMLKPLKDGDLERAQLGLGHSYSRAKVKFNVNRADNMIIQAISLLDQLDKDINTFSMRVREWYGWHFPELVKIVNDNYQYAKLAKVMRDKSSLTEESLDEIEEVVGDPAKAKQILEAAKSSMGQDLSEVDMANIESFADRVISLADYRKKLHGYLVSKMHVVAPNLSALIGEVVGARLISHAGSLTNLSKYPASTVQILGAEKALFRALKTKGNTPKYGLIYHSTFIGRAGAKNKGRISRFLANKCSIASRIDCFQGGLALVAALLDRASSDERAESQTNKFGEALKDQVEERLQFYETGAAPRKNSDVMKKVLESTGVAMDIDEDSDDAGEKVRSKKEGKKRKSEAADDEEERKRRKAERKLKKKLKKERRKSKKDKSDSDSSSSS